LLYCYVFDTSPEDRINRVTGRFIATGVDRLAARENVDVVAKQSACTELLLKALTLLAF
jgi:hypothetical protein